MWKPPRNLPNWLTIARIALAVMLFAILHSVGWSEALAPEARGPTATWILQRLSLLLNSGLAIFLLAAITDILDGNIARYYGLTTDFGRIADPFADKVIVSGAFLFLVSIAGSGVAAWMVVVIVARESLIDGIRGFAESRGIAFPSSFWGKTKMVTQSACIAVILFVLANFRDSEWGWWATRALLGLTIFMTLFSGALYVLKARTILRRGAMVEEPSPDRTPVAGR